MTKKIETKSKRFCIYCESLGKESSIELEYMLEATEKPYRNILFHRECHKKIPNLELFLLDNLDLWYN